MPLGHSPLRAARPWIGSALARIFLQPTWGNTSPRAGYAGVNNGLLTELFSAPSEVGLEVFSAQRSRPQLTP